MHMGQGPGLGTGQHVCTPAGRHAPIKANMQKAGKEEHLGDGDADHEAEHEERAHNHEGNEQEGNVLVGVPPRLHADPDRVRRLPHDVCPALARRHLRGCGKPAGATMHGSMSTVSSVSGKSGGASLERPELAAWASEPPVVALLVAGVCV
jgi:hypothetical protein